MNGLQPWGSDEPAGAPLHEGDTPEVPYVLLCVPAHPARDARSKPIVKYRISFFISFSPPVLSLGTARKPGMAPFLIHEEAIVQITVIVLIGARGTISSGLHSCTSCKECQK